MPMNLRGLRVEHQRRFGDVYLGLALWQRLNWMPPSMRPWNRAREEIPWGTKFGDIHRDCHRFPILNAVLLHDNATRVVVDPERPPDQAA